MPAFGKSGTLRIFALSESIGCLSRHTKTAEAIRRLDIECFDIIHTRARRPAPDRHFKSMHRVDLAFSHDLDASVVLVAHVATHVLTKRGIFDKETVAHALHAAPDDVPARHEHG